MDVVSQRNNLFHYPIVKEKSVGGRPGRVVARQVVSCMLLVVVVARAIDLYIKSE